MGCGPSQGGIVSPLSRAVILPHIAWFKPGSPRNAVPPAQVPPRRLAPILLDKGVQVDNLLNLIDRYVQTDPVFGHLSFDSDDLPPDDELAARPLVSSDVETQTAGVGAGRHNDDVKNVLLQTVRMQVDMRVGDDKVTIDIGIQVVCSTTDHFTQTERLLRPPAYHDIMQGSRDWTTQQLKELLSGQSSPLPFKRRPTGNKGDTTTADFESQTDPVTRALAANAADPDLNILDTIDATPIAHIEKELNNAKLQDSIARLLEDVEESLRHHNEGGPSSGSILQGYGSQDAFGLAAARLLAPPEVEKREAGVQTDNDPITDESPEFAARPPPCKKREIIPNLNIFKDIDQHAMGVPETARSSVKSLVQYLVTGCANDLHKVRAFFRWIANNITYDWRYLEVKLSAEEVLRRGEGVCKDYVKLFSEMCRLSGVRVKKVQGFAKGYDYRPGHNFQPGQDTTHAWNAVFIFGSWRLIDTTWGTGYTDHTGRFQRKINEHFFLTDPEVMVWTHYPYDEMEQEFERWQLVDKPLTLEDFNALPKVTPFFFEYCLKVRTKPQNPISFKVQTEIKVSSHEPMRFKFKLYPADELENPSLNNYVFCQLKEDRLVGSFSVIPPMEGRYYLKVYGKPEREMKNDTSLHNVVIFFLECIRARKYLQPYPSNEVPWGPTQSFFDYRMKLINHSGPVVTTWGGRRKLTLEIVENMIITSQLFDADAMEVDMKTMITREDTDKRVVFTVCPNRMGHFKFLIFGMPKPKQRGKWRLPLLASFLVDCKLCRQPFDEDNPPPQMHKPEKEGENDKKGGKNDKKKKKGRKFKGSLRLQ